MQCVCQVDQDWTHILQVSIANKSRICNLEKGYIKVNTNNQSVTKKPNNILYYIVMFVLNKNFGLVKTITLRGTILKTIYITVEIICLNKVLGLIKILFLS